jgi:acyl-CoA reductase-like NAD-dependent aldehyde dehydrogenase
MSALGLGTIPQSLINGVLTEGKGADIQLVDPYSEEVLLTYPDAGEALANLACDAAQHAQVHWAKGISAAGRGQIMQDIVRAVLANLETLATIEAIVAGKPIRDCRIEVAKVAEMFAY